MALHRFTADFAVFSGVGIAGSHELDSVPRPQKTSVRRGSSFSAKAERMATVIRLERRRSDLFCLDQCVGDFASIEAFLRRQEKLPRTHWTEFRQMPALK